MKSFAWMIAGVVAALVGAAVWAGIVYYSNWEIGWIAWLMGVFVGVAVAAAAKDEVGLATGVGAACIAAGSVLAGKYAVVQLVANDVWSGELGAGGEPEVTEEMLIAALARQLADEREAAGEVLEWPEIDEESEEEVATADLYPPVVWEDAEERWRSADETYRAEHRAYVEASMASMMAEFKSMMVQEGFLASFTPRDGLWLLLAVASAWGIGSGRHTGGEG
ncbi:MAG TPA: hypothetical protein VFF69_12480 [Phycisphaerales bacterium]|nr:hypothetical protein [Phycisphaerales bacterium]